MTTWLPVHPAPEPKSLATFQWEKIMPLPTPYHPWSHIAIDFITDLPESDGKTVILVITDRFSRSLQLIPLKSLPTAFELAELMFIQVFRFFGLPKDMGDHAPQFTSQVWHSFLEKLGATVSRLSGYHPKANGQVERLNQEVRRFLHKFCADNQRDWACFLPWAEYTQNSLNHTATQMTPFQCVLGYQPVLFLQNNYPTNAPAVDDWLRQSEAVWECTDQRLEQVAATNKHFADRWRNETLEYDSGDRVKLSTQDLCGLPGCRKLLDKFSGPYIILQRVRPVTYRLALPRHSRLASSFQVLQLKAVMAGALDAKLPSLTPPAPCIIDGQCPSRCPAVFCGLGGLWT